ncbi:S-methyl-5-thioribose-1-phosphate isomerase [Spizellomyces sp. 'palustris']|nr:S-methyl-5-thioribose-1-phosphate isomerase [Spizellomyces sp. 'palustris']
MLKEINYQIDSLVAKLRRRQIVGSYNVAIATSRLLRNVVAASRCNDVEQLSALVKEVGSRLEGAQPIELAVGNMVKRVLHLIKEEHNVVTEASDAAETAETTSETDDFGERRRNFVADVKQSIEEMIDELENTSTNISNQAWEHIHSKEIILTVGRSKTVEHFLKVAAQVREFQVIVAETAPSYQGHEMALALSSAGIDTTVITDTAIFAVMSRVNKVILGAHAVTANGGVVAVCGSQLVAAAAKEYSTPIVVCTGLHKLSPSYPYDTDIFNLCINPDAVYSFEAGDIIDRVDIVNPHFDYVGPEDVSLFITNVGTHPPSFVQRLIYDTYIVDEE